MQSVSSTPVIYYIVAVSRESTMHGQSTTEQMNVM